MSKTLTYGLYSFVPLALGVLADNLVAAMYFYLERIKSICVTCFQPIFQGAFLVKSFLNLRNGSYVSAIIAASVFFDVIIFAFAEDIVEFVKFDDEASLLLLALTVNICVFSYSIIYLFLLPNKLTRLLALSMYFQSLVIFGSLLLFYFSELPAIFILLFAEAGYFSYLVYHYLKNRFVVVDGVS
ncbi:MAG: hypothetical protein VX986_04370 [Pseudomonadota bacterium]|nr:hypothetical protein [Pseudomonadota bacterium]